MQPIGAAAHGDVDHAAAGTAKFGSHAAGLHLELLDGVDGGNDGELVELRRCIRDAIQQNLIAHGGPAVDREIALRERVEWHQMKSDHFAELYVMDTDERDRLKKRIERLESALKLLRRELEIRADGVNLVCNCTRKNCSYHVLGLQAGDVLYRVSYADSNQFKEALEGSL